MRRLGILGTLLVMSCGGHLDLGTDTSGGVGGAGAPQASGGKTTGDKTGGATAAGGSDETAMGGATGGSGSKATGGSDVASGGAGGSEPVTRCAHVKAVPASGNWEGQSEDFLFEPIDKYRVEIAGVDETGSLCGSVTFGDTEALAPADDPEGAYPPGSDPIELKGGIFQLWPGATYSILAGAERGSTVRFEVSSQEVMESWCALQTSYSLEMGADYNCLPTLGYSTSVDSATGALSCSASDENGMTVFETTAARCYQCASDCTCSASGCTARTGHSIVFDLELSPDESQLNGAVGATSLRLERQ